MTDEAPSLLITDDDRDFRETLGNVFDGQGFRTWLAADGEEAVRIVRSEEVHVVLMDMHMPRLTGLEALKQVRQFHTGLPCILISAGLDESILDQARQACVFSVLRKPLSYVEVMDTVGRALHEIYNWP